MFYKAILFIVGSLFLLPLFSQDCGISDEDQSTWLPKYLAHLSSNDLSTFTTNEYKIPIALHLVARDNGVGRAKVATALEVLCELNDLYATTGISFYLPSNGINFVDHDGVFMDNNFAINQLAMQNERRDSALNVFVVNSVGASNVVGLYDANRDWVLLQKSVFVSGNKTLAHEIGHLFALLHPHFGWDGQAWDVAIHGNPSPEIASNGVTLTEKMDGSNCAEAGDLLCDTPPDYNFGIDWTQSCDYAGGATDPDNVLVNPDERLIMSYFSNSCRQVFSEEQIAIMQLDLEHPSREYLHPGYTPTADSLASLAELIAPAGMVNITSNTLDFSWEVVPGAQYYYIEYDRSPDFDLDPQGVITTQNATSISHPWLSGLNYYWRVLTWNELYFCSPPSTTQEFTVDITSSVLAENPENTLNMFSTPGKLTLEYQLADLQGVDLKIYSLEGKEMFSKAINLSSGKGMYRLDVPMIPQGIFIVTIAGGIQLNKLIYFP
ncbi:hypothetical protein [Lewinella cohaerens]|uniref:hypothetical protein n=1 Tax=Lewinella cohaerens TaxID=70995 RepID=UPI00035E141F|nr:hypothetical protein [Lewinella cohaerens]